MSFPAYELYQEVGISWLDEVPAHWAATRIDHVTDFINGKAHEPFVDDDGEFICVNSRFISTDGEALKLCTENITPAETDDVLMVMSDLPNGRALARTYHVQDGRQYAINQRVCAIRSKGPTPRFLFYLLNRNPWFLRNDDGLNQTHLPSAAFQKMPLFLPPEDEQKAISSFLDVETSKIDGLVSEQRRLIELLKEKRQAVISHAVTKGLNPNAPMKPSGIQWLGDVPQHWAVGAVKHFVASLPGAIKTGPFGSHLKSSEMESGTVKVYNQRNVIDNDFESGENFVSEDKFVELSSFEAFPGDVMVTTRGTIGRAAILPENVDRGILHPCLLRIQVDESRLERRFLKTLIQDSELMKTQLAYLSNATTIEVIYSNTMASVVIPVPPLCEQEEILQFLDDAVGKFDSLLAEAERAIELLQERRTALISAAVTGKIDVRESARVGATN